ncbi:MAG: CD3324 family protein [Clostridium sp.]|uniref:CD3324 family protein n=1 Tax=Clostridium sp. TaxID=1506 RepID=UPI00304FA320
MSYMKAQNILPEELINIIQTYIDGEYIYIPRKSDNKKSWGECKGTRNNFKDRNINIYTMYQQGYTVSQLSQKYFLAEKTIQKIILKLKNI